MCRMSRCPSRIATPFFCLYVLIVVITIAGCTEHAPASAPDNLTIHFRCSSPCALDFRLNDGHVRIGRDEFARNNCSVFAGASQVTIDCPADLSQWTADQNPHREYPATPRPTS